MSLQEKTGERRSSSCAAVHVLVYAAVHVLVYDLKNGKFIQGQHGEKNFLNQPETKTHNPPTLNLH